MKNYKTVLTVAIAICILVTAVFPLNVHAMEECEVVVDVSDMVYQVGGWGTPMSEIAMYAMDEREQLKETILNGILSGEAPVDISSYNLMIDNEKELAILYAELLNEHPELFYVNPSFKLLYRGEQIIYLYFYHVKYTDEERQAYVERLEQVTKEISPDMTDVEKALALHDYLAQHCAYAYSEALEGSLGDCKNIFNAYGALVEGKAVCQGYALAYSALLRAVGIASSLCTSDSMNHAWNVILIDDEWYHVDVTWDDPAWNVEGKVNHIYFLLSDLEMSNRNHYDWNSVVECTSAKYDTPRYWWNAVKSQIILGDKQYYIEKYGTGFQLMEKDADVAKAKYVKKTVWEVWDGGGRYWTDYYTYMSSQGDYLYFNDKLNLYAMKPEDSEPQIIYTYEGGDGYIYGAMVYEDGTARLNIDTSPNRTTDSYITVDLKAASPILTIDYETGIISTTEAMEYSVDGGTTWIPCAINMNMTNFGWNGTKNVVVSFRTAEAGGRFASEATALTLEALPGVLSGTVKGFGNEGENTTLQLLDTNRAVVAENTVIGSYAEYQFEDVVPGTYTLKVTKPNHVAREYTLMVGESAPVQNVELHLMGDINGDGMLNARDKKMVFNHIASITSLTDYDLAVADVNGDGNVNARDKKILYNHIAGLALLW